MGLALNGQLYEGWYTPVYKGDKIDCGLNYDPITDTTELTTPKTIFELAAPGYYYTDTDFLRSIDAGFSDLANSLVGSTRNVQVLIKSRDNYKCIDDDVYIEEVFYYWYLLAQTQFNKDLAPSDLKTAYDKLSILANSLDPVYIIPQSKLRNLVFYDYAGAKIPLTTYALSRVGKVRYCNVVDPSNISNDHLIHTYHRNGISYDIYIGSYHIVVYKKSLGAYYFSTNNITKQSNEEAIDYKFFDYSFPVTLDERPSQDDEKLKELGYSFSADSSGKTLFISDGNPTIGNANETFICYGSNSYQGDSITGSDSDIQRIRTTWFNASPNIYTKIGKLPDDTIGVLPKGADMNNVGAGSDKITDLFYTGTKLTDLSASTPDKLLFPLGTYYLDPNATYADYRNFPVVSNTSGGTPISITAYTLDGMTVMQEAVWRGFATYRRVGYQSGLGKTTWTGWSQRKWN